MLENLLNDEPLLIKVTSEDNKMELLYLTKYCLNDTIGYSLSLFEETNGETSAKGFISFDIDFDNFSSTITNLNICSKYNNPRIISYLLASWLSLCESESIISLKSPNSLSNSDLASILSEFSFATNNSFECFSNNTKKSYIRARRIIDEI